ncbi:hypothetical protein ACIHCQ_42275 [Streptomyces sp. NPDC052236]|uniref:hypothetical protein n=1 Tax=Streptomyces sp. NPDC052236 TaxID=3365686 RepID=UPI0037D463DE
MARWLIEIPMVTNDGQPKGVQLFHYDADYTAARTQALADVDTEDAIRHRRGARLDVSRLKIRAWVSSST